MHVSHHQFNLNQNKLEFNTSQNKIQQFIHRRYMNESNVPIVVLVDLLVVHEPLIYFINHEANVLQHEPRFLCDPHKFHLFSLLSRSVISNVFAYSSSISHNPPTTYSPSPCSSHLGQSLGQTSFSPFTHPRRDCTCHSSSPRFSPPFSSSSLPGWIKCPSMWPTFRWAMPGGTIAHKTIFLARRAREPTPVNDRGKHSLE